LSSPADVASIIEPWGSLDVDALALGHLSCGFGREIVAADSTENWGSETIAKHVGAATMV